MAGDEQAPMTEDAMFREAIGQWATIDIETAITEAHSLFEPGDEFGRLSYKKLLQDEATSERVKDFIRRTAHLDDDERADLFEEIFAVLVGIQSSSEGALQEQQILLDCRDLLKDVDPVDAVGAMEAICRAQDTNSIPKLMLDPATPRWLKTITRRTEDLVKQRRTRVFEALLEATMARAADILAA